MSFDSKKNNLFKDRHLTHVPIKKKIKLDLYFENMD
jgi:hypothetical protein